MFETIKNSRYLVKSETFCWQPYSCHNLLLSYLSFPHLWCPCLGFNLSLISNTIIHYLDMKKAIRIISFSEPKSHYEPLFKSLNLLKLNDVIESQILSCLSVVMQNVTPVSVNISKLLLLFIRIQRGNHVIEIFTWPQLILPNMAYTLPKNHWSSPLELLAYKYN